MAFKASITFTGLCAFVRNTGRDRMRVLLLKDSEHTPAIVFDVRDLEPRVESDQPDPPRPAFERIGNSGVWVLNQYDVTLNPRGDTNRFNLPNPTNVGLRPTPSSEHLLDWLPRMSRVSNGAGPILYACLGGNSEDLRRLIAGRIRVMHGSPITSRHTEVLGQPLVWDFRVNGSAPIHHTQTLGEEVKIQLSGLDELVLDGVRFDNTAPVRIRLKNKSGDDELSVAIKNVEPEQIERPQENSYPATFDDFRSFYHICKNGGREENIPHKRRSSLSGSLFRGNESGEQSFLETLAIKLDEVWTLSRPICPGAVFDDHANA